MDPLKGIIVQIISGGKILKTYDDSESNEEDDRYTRQRYVEALAGSSFQVKVLLTTQFRLYHLKPEDGVQVTLDIDGRDVVRTNLFHRRKSIDKEFLKGRPATFEFSSIEHFSAEAEDSANTCVSLEQAKQLGKIRVEIFRITLEESAPRPRSMKAITPIIEVPEKVLKGKAVVHTVKLTGGRSTHAPTPYTITSKRVDGTAGKSIIYDLYYRSRQALQSLGYIPPEQASETMIIQNDNDGAGAARIVSDRKAPNEVLQEVKNLRAQLALLERTLNVETESPSTSARVKSEAGRRIKREREVDESAARRQRRRTSGNIETVDLTDD